MARPVARAGTRSNLRAVLTLCLMKKKICKHQKYSFFLKKKLVVRKTEV
jgi:hypothetical protein